MANFNGSEAYDFERFAVKKQRAPEKAPDNIVKLPVKKTKPQSSVTLPKIIKALGICLAVFALVGSVIYNQLSLNELNASIRRADKALGESQSEYIQLQMAAAASVTDEEIEEFARANSMQKLQNAQIEYIHLNDGDKVEVAGNAGQGNIFQRIADWFSGLWS